MLFTVVIVFKCKLPEKMHPNKQDISGIPFDYLRYLP